MGCSGLETIIRSSPLDSSSSSFREARAFEWSSVILDVEAPLEFDSKSTATFRFFFGRPDDTRSGVTVREVLVSGLWKRSSFLRFVPAAGGLLLFDRVPVECVTVVEDLVETLEVVDARLWIAVMIHENMAIFIEQRLTFAS